MQIELGKVGVLPIFFEHYEVLVPKAVYREAAVRGMAEHRADASQLDQLLRMHPGVIRAVRVNPQAQAIVEARSRLGAGEVAALHLYFEERSDAVVSDDRVFLRLLAENQIPSLTSLNVITTLAQRGHMSTETALAALDEIRQYVRADEFTQARSELSEKQGGS